MIENQNKTDQKKEGQREKTKPIKIKVTKDENGNNKRRKTYETCIQREEKDQKFLS